MARDKGVSPVPSLVFIRHNIKISTLARILLCPDEKGFC
jgi:hypothetical protein